MHRVERFRLLFGDAHALLGNDPQSRLFDHRIDGAREIARRGVGLDDRKRALHRHWQSVLC
jgi:hypothetical protein